ncbi:MAG: hypothetical protein QME94_03355 [Anaerolineae bacterium]|nr:hypothetical protein [Anaerolineae bacterium]
MKQGHPQRDTHSFVVRIWHEPEDAGDDPYRWRGTIDQVSSGRRLYFHDLDTFVRFVEEQAGLRVRKGPREGATRRNEHGGTGA